MMRLAGRARLMVATVALALVALLVPTTAHASHYGVCNLNGHRYCVDRAWGPIVADAVTWSYAHTSRNERRPVPYPTRATLIGVFADYHVVYRVSYTGREGSLTWKFGITRQERWQDRANVGRRDCAKKHGSCRIQAIAETGKSDGYYWARLVEASMIKQYERANGVCPPGQRKSCK